MKAITALISNSPKRHNLLVFGKLVLPDLLQPTYLPEIRSLKTLGTNAACGDGGMCLDVIALFEPVPLGKLQWDRTFTEGSEMGA